MNDDHAHTMMPTRSREIIVGGLLVGGGTILCLTGVAISSTALAAAARDLIVELRQPTAAAVRRTMAYTRAATAAGARALHEDDIAAEHAGVFTS